MASITKKVIRGRTYYYARQCKRVNGKPKIVWQKYLGRLDNIITAVSEHREAQLIPQPQKEGIVTDLGAVAALYDLASRLDLVSVIDKHVSKRGDGPSVGTYLLVAVINRCVDPRSKAKVAQSGLTRLCSDDWLILRAVNLPANATGTTWIVFHRKRSPVSKLT